MDVTNSGFFIVATLSKFIFLKNFFWRYRWWEIVISFCCTLLWRVKNLAFVRFDVSSVSSIIFYFVAFLETSPKGDSQFPTASNNNATCFRVPNLPPLHIPAEEEEWLRVNFCYAKSKFTFLSDECVSRHQSFYTKVENERISFAPFRCVLTESRKFWKSLYLGTTMVVVYFIVLCRHRSRFFSGTTLLRAASGQRLHGYTEAYRRCHELKQIGHRSESSKGRYCSCPVISCLL